MKTVAVELTEDEAKALVYAYEISEYPVSNPLGEGGPDLLDSAEAKLRRALGLEVHAG